MLSAVMKLIPVPWLIAGALAAAGAALGAAYVKGRVDGRDVLTARLAADRVDILKDGRKIDAEALAADDDALCRLLGGCMPEHKGGD